jgi:hypothetical protein
MSKNSIRQIRGAIRQIGRGIRQLAPLRLDILN